MRRIKLIRQLRTTGCFSRFPYHVPEADSIMTKDCSDSGVIFQGCVERRNFSFRFLSQLPRSFRVADECYFP